MQARVLLGNAALTVRKDHYLTGLDGLVYTEALG